MQLPPPAAGDKCRWTLSPHTTLLHRNFHSKSLPNRGSSTVPPCLSPSSPVSLSEGKAGRHHWPNQRINLRREHILRSFSSRHERIQTHTYRYSYTPDYSQATHVIILVPPSPSQFTNLSVRVISRRRCHAYYSVMLANLQ